ncbi:Phage repressor protein C, contains Cro/C1-type HTH and peptisase s24 domains [Hymenobacter mucosus]|uniref:Phage repressor protein C, contains Cro/C1-type HTH and peptisase s24 domains n=2 Tax=Hymenobacter mucosus TaxID=1411120 RepID=A0A238X249_9BACT|nr:Phage repressor protein C, contains Cro/C1-type HTH and peptisase s24 domains [Hymenobacter mucosus]
MTEESLRTTIGERLRIVRQVRGLTQQQMADLLGVKRPTVTQLEASRHQPSQDVLEAIVRELDISRNWLWFGIGPMEEATPGLNGNARLAHPLDEEDYEDWIHITVPARAGFGDLFDTGGVAQFDTIRIYSPSPELRGRKTWVIDVDGDSMEPQLRSGMQVAAILLPLEDCKYAVSGVYAVVFGSQFAIKRIKDNDLLTKGYLVLHSDNENAGSLTVAGEDIRYMWRVLEIIRGKVL